METLQYLRDTHSLHFLNVAKYFKKHGQGKWLSSNFFKGKVDGVLMFIDFFEPDSDLIKVTTNDLGIELLHKIRTGELK